MVEIPGGEFTMGSNEHYREEAPAHRVRVDDFRIDRHPVTNAQYAAFVSETGYETVAQRPLDPADYPGVADDLLVPGSLVFHGTPGPVPLNDPSHWWAYVPDANWREPLGPESENDDLADHPVTGGYPVVAYVHDDDVDRCAQLRPGQRVRFRCAAPT